MLLASRQGEITPFESVTKMFSRFTPKLTVRSRQAMAAAPAPEAASLTLPMFLPTTFRAFGSAALEMIALHQACSHTAPKDGIE
jgi:hypothetical protein